MNRDETIAYIHSLGKFRFPASLERIKNVCRKLGDPQNAFKSIHIAGTNGKGSTAQMLSNILIKSGFKTGTFISPFIIDFNERIGINGEFISDNDLCLYAEKVKDTGVELNEFEFITAMCFLYFRDKKVDIAVMETGLGGRLDATNVLGDVSVSVITKIGLDHTAVLGDTIEKIAAEKCGIIRRGVPVVTVCNQDEKALSVIKKHSGDLTVPETPKILRSDLCGNEFLYRGKKFELSLLGEHQIYNAVTAIEAVGKFSPGIPYEVLKSALFETVFPARLEIVSKEPLVIIDGAHNPDGGQALAKFLETVGQKVTVVCAMMRDKNCHGFIEKTAKYTDLFIATGIDLPRCLPASELETIAGEYIENTRAISDVKTALSEAERTKNPVFVIGSLYLASKVRKYYKK
ncbi:MAG: bifunctional folylpolyglutamate synthase/dihydrofolate synthase [Clostridia bacterium]|nr:bifunctional folylpolyglutamate synthase/dihydrofolate synthase [Clostridia bacterium]